MKFDRKLLLIAPTIVLLFVVGGMFYEVSQLRVLTASAATWRQRSDYVASVENGTRELSAAHAVKIVRYSLDAERRRTDAIDAASDLLMVLAGMAGVSLLVLAEGIRRIPREHWPSLEQARWHRR